VTTIFCVLAVPVCRACGTASTLSHSASSQSRAWFHAPAKSRISRSRLSTLWSAPGAFPEFWRMTFLILRPFDGSFAFSIGHAGLHYRACALR